MTRKIHNWTSEEEEKLEQAVHNLEPYAATCDERNWPKSRFWDGVAGRMAPEVCVSGKACYERWKKIQASKEQEQPDGWETVASRVEEYERDLALETYEMTETNTKQISHLRHEVAEITNKLDRLLAELGVKL